MMMADDCSLCCWVQLGLFSVNVVMYLSNALLRHGVRSRCVLVQ